MNRIALVISDVDGTLVTPDKQLAPATVQAVRKLRDRGIGFTVTSSRPPFGLRMLVEPLDLTLPMGAFNGSSIVDAALNVIEQRLIPEAAARRSIALLQQAGVDIWLFTTQKWLILRDDGTYVPREQHTIDANPTVVSELDEFAPRACKIVGVSADPEKLARCETAMQQALGGHASAIRSQTYYLDITPAGRDKGTFVDAMARRLDIAPARIATIGDMQNDLAMFAKSGLSIAMGNATPDVKAKATRVIASNENDGVAKAIEDILAGIGQS